MMPSGAGAQVWYYMPHAERKCPDFFDRRRCPDPSAANRSLAMASILPG